ncbi:MAG TPA: response regulator [Thermomicrobiales bacterium]|nr:response regulator [Thermomicrobiales bacterium]
MHVTKDPTTSPRAQWRRRILVINDSPAFLSLMREILEVEGGYDVATFDKSDGVVIGSNGAPPDLIILDIAFRDGPSGLELAEQLSGAAETARVPVLFCTALREQDIDEHARDLASARNQRILYKPFDVDDVLTLVAELLSPVMRE